MRRTFLREVSKSDISEEDLSEEDLSEKGISEEDIPEENISKFLVDISNLIAMNKFICIPIYANMLPKNIITYCQTLLKDVILH